MAPVSKNPVCGACPKRVTNSSGGIKCEGNCAKWFHFECGGKSKSEYSFSKGEKPNFVCSNCEQLLEQRNSAVSNLISETVSENFHVNCECFDHIKILTDQIFDLTKNQRELSNLLGKTRAENAKLVSILNSHTEAIGNILINNSNHLTYASVLRSSADNLNSFTVINKFNEDSNIKIDGAVGEQNLTMAVNKPDFLSARKIREYNSMLPPAPVSKKITSGNVKHKFIKSAVVGTGCESGEWQAGLHGNNSMLNPVSVNSTALSSVSAVCGVKEPSDYDAREPENESSEPRRDNTNNLFVEVNYKKRKMPGQSRPRTGKRCMFLTGSATVNSDKLKIVEKNRHIFVSRLSEDMECEGLRQYLKDCSDGGSFEVTKLKTRYPGYSSFKIGIPLTLWDKVYDPDFWPMGTYVSRFRNISDLTGNNAIFNQLQLMKRQYRCALREAKKHSNENFIEGSTNKCKAAWTVINKAQKRTTSCGKAPDISPDDFNSFFISSV
ncbi:hypothetical protein J6590_070019 [Homalodisca vitripennis]|nr:hypothetical protein J6590_070019 [Homalodisca vitripennis]